MYLHSKNWNTWSRVVLYDNQTREAIVVALKPALAHGETWQLDVKDIAFRIWPNVNHWDMEAEIPGDIRHEMEMAMGEDFVQNLLEEDLLEQVDLRVLRALLKQQKGPVLRWDAIMQSHAA